MSDADVAEVELPPPSTTFDHRQALLELFADLELHHEVVRHSLRGYDTALPRPDDQAAPPSPSGSEKMSPQARPGSVKVAPLPGILRVPTETFGNRGRHRYHHHHHHHHHRHQRRCETIVEEHQPRTDHQNSDVTNGSNDDVTERRSSRGNMSLVIQQPDCDVKCTTDISENSGKFCGEGGKSSGCEGAPNDLSDSIAELRVSSASFRKFSTAV